MAGGPRMGRTHRLGGWARTLRRTGTRNTTAPVRREQILTRRSPREHRATRKRQRDLVATDFTVDQGLEVECARLASQDVPTRLRDDTERRNQQDHNDEKATTAVARDRLPSACQRHEPIRFPEKGRSAERGKTNRLTRHS